MVKPSMVIGPSLKVYPGVIAWFYRDRAELDGHAPIDVLDDPKYEDAVKTGAPEKMLTAIQAQAAIERRALVTVAAIQEGR